MALLKREWVAAGGPSPKFVALAEGVAPSKPPRMGPARLARTQTIWNGAIRISGRFWLPQRGVPRSPGILSDLMRSILVGRPHCPFGTVGG